MWDAQRARTLPDKITWRLPHPQGAGSIINYFLSTMLIISGLMSVNVEGEDGGAPIPQQKQDSSRCLCGLWTGKGHRVWVTGVHHFSGRTGRVCCCTRIIFFFFFVYETFILSKGYTIALANRVCTRYTGNVVLIYKHKLIIMKVVLKSGNRWSSYVFFA